MTGEDAVRQFGSVKQSVPKLSAIRTDGSRISFDGQQNCADTASPFRYFDTSCNQQRRKLPAVALFTTDATARLSHVHKISRRRVH